MAQFKVSKFQMRFPEYAIQSDDFTVQAGEYLLITAPSGFGKTTLMRGLIGLEEAAKGEVWLDSTRLDLLPVHQRNFGVVFQDQILFPHLTAFENALFGIKLRRKVNAEDVKQVEEEFKRYEIYHRKDARPHELSGGEKQRVALIRALAFQPNVLFMDEPLKGLDPVAIEKLVSNLRETISTRPIPVIWISHQAGSGLLGDSIIGIEHNGQRYFKYHRT